jgi:hypothetical protein
LLDNILQNPRHTHSFLEININPLLDFKVWHSLSYNLFRVFVRHSYHHGAREDEPLISGRQVEVQNLFSNLACYLNRLFTYSLNVMHFQVLMFYMMISSIAQMIQQWMAGWLWIGNDMAYFKVLFSEGTEKNLHTHTIVGEAGWYPLHQIV